ncbi:MAG: hypothetical protein ABI432_06425 [Flavobacteriales bacterium]
MRAYTTLFLILVSRMLVHAQGPQDPVRTGSLEQARHGFFGDLNAGISNYGMAGAATVYYRSGRTFFSAGYYRSHLCCAGDYDGIPSWSSGAADHHVSVASYSAEFGYLLPSGWKQGISAGISISRIGREETDPIENDFSIGGVSRELSGEGFEDHSHGKGCEVVLGIPIEYKVFLLQKGTIGLDMAARVDINRTMIFGAITLGVRIGK